MVFSRSRTFWVGLNTIDSTLPTFRSTSVVNLSHLCYFRKECHKRLNLILDLKNFKFSSHS